MDSFCEAVWAFAEDESYFSIQSLKQAGFDSPLFELGFSDWFYSNVLVADDRFSYSNAFGNMIFCKGDTDVTIRSFLVWLVRAEGSVDVFDLMTELTETYGCVVPEKWDIIYRFDNTDIYHDKYLDRLYANEELYYRELDETEDR